MIISQLDSHTSAANVTMEEPFFRPDAANATPFAVKRFLFVPFVVEHVADRAEVLPKLYTTRIAILLRSLNMLTF